MSPDHGITIGFARGISPSKWSRRYTAAFPDRSIELAPIDIAYGRDGTPCDVMIERALPGREPEGVPEGTRRAIALYWETLALVVPMGHELADAGEADVADLALVPLLDYPEHARSWPEPEPWSDASFMPRSIRAALDLVATGLGGILLPRPLAQHLIRKRDHAIVPLTGEHLPEGTSVWATWDTERDAPDVQDLVGILRGRTAHSSRSESGGVEHPASDASARRGRGDAPATQKKLNPNSRGAQLAAARDRARRQRGKRK